MTFKFNPFTKKLDYVGSGGGPATNGTVVLQSGTFDTKLLTPQLLFTPSQNFILQTVMVVATDIQNLVTEFDTFTLGTNSPSYDDLDTNISGSGLTLVDYYKGANPSYSSGTPVVTSGTDIYGLILGAASDADVYDVVVYAIGVYI